MNLRRTNLLLVLLGWVLWSASSLAQDVTQEQVKGLDEQVQDIKADVLEITTELSLLEEKLLFPSNTQVSVFVSLAGTDAFVLDSVQILLDDKVVARYLYSFKELQALRLGGVQRIYTGNIQTGEHRLVASFIGRSASGDAYQRTADFSVSKDVGPKFVEIRIFGENSSDQDIAFQDW